MHFSDPEIEKTAQEAISKFFSENQIIPSPFNKEPTKMELPTTPTHCINNSNCSSASFNFKIEKQNSELIYCFYNCAHCIYIYVLL